MLWRLLRLVLFCFDAEKIHGLSHRLLGWLGRRALTRSLTGPRRHRDLPDLGSFCLGLKFAHPLGLAAGFDKGEVDAPGLWALGFSHIEIGTVTPRPQGGNPTPRLFRLPEHQALINRMGFNNEGAARCAERLALLNRHNLDGLIGVNVGRNKDTPNEFAEADYLACLRLLAPYADYLVVNLSSPNTPGLRELQERRPLGQLIAACVAQLQASPHPRPLLVKLAPDLTDEALEQAVEVAVISGANGILATNTTISRPGSTAGHRLAAEAGGLSGAPLGPRSTATVAAAYKQAAGRVPIIGIGGIMNAADAYEKIRAGASLVQAYTGFIYGGPFWPRKVTRELAELLRRDGFSSVGSAVGTARSS